MLDDKTIVVLNDLLTAEYESLIPRLGEADPFVTWPAAADRALVERMLTNVEDHERDLTELILTVRGSPVPRRFAMASGGVHYVKLAYLMPAVIESIRKLIETYEHAGPTENTQADALIAHHLSDYQGHLAALTRMHSNLIQSESR